MSRFLDVISKPARDLGAMNVPSTTPAALDRRSRLVKLDSNENPFGPSARAVDAIREVLKAANSYPDDDCSQLRYRLAEHHGLPPDHVLVTAGSTEMLSLLCQTLLGAGLNAVPASVHSPCTRWQCGRRVGV
jgi:histidinol-phosphate aminotransferase